MPKAHFDARYGRWIAICALAALAIPWSLVHAGRAIQERRPADPQGEIEIFNVSGMVEVEGWDRSEVEVDGHAGDTIEQIDVTSAGRLTSIHVVSRSGRGWGSDDEAHLIVHVPARSAVTATLVSSGFKVKGLLGDLKVQAVSGNLSGETGGDLRVSSVSGDVRLTARSAKTIEVKTISGDIKLIGGGGEVEVTTVSGSATIELGEVSRGRFKSVSGDMTVALGLAADGRIDSESVSGELSFQFAAAPAAEFDVQTFSGDIENCFGPKPIESRYGPGSRLEFQSGAGRGHVRVNTKSGGVRLCVKGMKPAHASALPVPRLPVAWLPAGRLMEARLVVPYVF
jgi:hypothetical protein